MLLIAMEWSNFFSIGITCKKHNPVNNEMTSICVDIIHIKFFICTKASEVFSHSTKIFGERHPEISNALSSVCLLHALKY